jgi:excisionase family DNA binding protein
MNQVYELLTAWYPKSWKDPLSFPIREPEEKPPGSLLTTEQAAEYLGICSETLRRKCKKRMITYIAVTPTDYRFIREHLDEYLQSHTVKRKSIR